MKTAPTAGRDDPRLALTLAEWRRRSYRRYALTIAIAIMLAVSFAATGGLEMKRYAEAGSTIVQLLIDATPPDFTRASFWFKPLFETIAMSIAATLAGSVLALPLALLAARNMGFPPVVSAMARLLLNAARSVPELVFGVVFVAAVGFGPLAGVLALACHSVGMLGKFTAEHIEYLDPGPMRALQSHGVTRAGIVRFCLLPQVLPRFIDVTLYRWEHNVRAASVMGIVGAGGLGLELVTAFSLFEYREAMALLILILIIVTAIDGLSGKLRKLLVSPGT